jgi:hypothetical protein
MLPFWLLALWLGNGPVSDPPKRYRLLVFEGSDWCRTCRTLERNVLNDSTFLKALQDRSIQLERVDFPQRAQQSEATRTTNRILAAQLGFKGQFPTLFLCRTDTLLFREIQVPEARMETLLRRLDQTLPQIP